MNASDVIKAMKNFQWDDLDYDNIKLFEKNIIVLLRPNRAQQTKLKAHTQSNCAKYG